MIISQNLDEFNPPEKTCGDIEFILVIFISGLLLLFSTRIDNIYLAYCILILCFRFLNREYCVLFATIVFAITKIKKNDNLIIIALTSIVILFIKDKNLIRTLSICLFLAIILYIFNYT